jgi:hypothetical protein
LNCVAARQLETYFQVLSSDSIIKVFFSTNAMGGSMVVVHSTAYAKIKGSNPLTAQILESFFDVPSSNGIRSFFPYQ